MSSPSLVSGQKTLPRRPRLELKDALWSKYRKASQGGTVENELVQRYLPLVKTVVGRMAMTLPSHVELDDLYSSGLVGLLSALRQFDPKNGSSFEGYARVRIRGAILDELRRMDWVPRSIHDKARRMQAAHNELEQAHGRVPTSAEVAEALEITEAEYEQWLEEVKPATFVCLDAAPHSDSHDHASQYESIADQQQENPVDGTARREMTRLIAERLEQLPEVQRKVLALYYFEDLRLREIAEAFGLTESRICQIHAQAILNIKAYLQKHENACLANA